MKCARCGGDIPEGSPSCPGCRLKVRMRAPGEGTPPPGPPIPSPPAEIAREQELPPEVYQVAEPSAPGEWPPKDTLSAPPPRPEQGKRKIPKAFIAIIVIGLLVLGGAAAAYFFLLREKGASGAEAAVEGYVRAVFAGDAETAKSFWTADHQALVVRKMTSLNASSSASDVELEVKDIKLKTVKESADEATVEEEDVFLHTSKGGYSLDTTMNQINNTVGERRVYKLIKQNGKWLITGVQITKD